MDVKEVAQYLRFSTKKLYQLIKSRQIPFKKIGGQYRFAKAEIDKWILVSPPAAGIREDAGEYPPSSDMKTLLERARSIQDKLKRYLYIMAVLTAELKKEKLRPVVVGGFALEFYTLGGYNTGDIDLVFSDNKILDCALKKMGFIKKGRHWISRELDVYIEAPGSGLTRGELDHMFEVDIDGMPVYIIGVEDLIIDRLNAFVHWKSTEEENWIKELIVNNFEKLDWEYLKKCSFAEKTSDALEKLLRDTKNEKNKLR